MNSTLFLLIINLHNQFIFGSLSKHTTLITFFRIINQITTFYSSINGGDFVFNCPFVIYAKKV
jgi:phage-related holin